MKGLEFKINIKVYKIRLLEYLSPGRNPPRPIDLSHFHILVFTPCTESASVVIFFLPICVLIIRAFRQLSGSYHIRVRVSLGTNLIDPIIRVSKWFESALVKLASLQATVLRLRLFW